MSLPNNEKRLLIHSSDFTPLRTACPFVVLCLPYIACRSSFENDWEQTTTTQKRNKTKQDLIKTFERNRLLSTMMSTSNTTNNTPPPDSTSTSTTSTTCPNSFIMVEHKHCVYDEGGDEEEVDPPLVHVTLAPDHPEDATAVTAAGRPFDTTTTPNSPSALLGEGVGGISRGGGVMPSAPPDSLDTNTTRSPGHVVRPSAPPDSLDNNSNANSRTSSASSTSPPSVVVLEQEPPPGPPVAARNLNGNSPELDPHHEDRMPPPPPTTGQDDQNEDGVNNNNNNNNNDDDNLWKASGTAAALLGLVFGGPLVAIIVGVGSIIGTTYQGAQGSIMGDISRALGEIALAARQKWTYLNQKHHIDQQFQHAIVYGIHKVKKWNQQYQIGKQCKEYVIRSWIHIWNSIRQRYPSWSERWGIKLEQGLEYLIEQYHRHYNQEHTPPPPTTSDPSSSSETAATGRTGTSAAAQTTSHRHHRNDD